MSMQDYSIDDLHQLALAEASYDPSTERMLNDVYASIRREYIIAMLLMREYQEQP
jgi:hypothetical protein